MGILIQKRECMLSALDKKDYITAAQQARNIKKIINKLRQHYGLMLDVVYGRSIQNIADNAEEVIGLVGETGVRGGCI